MGSPAQQAPGRVVDKEILKLLDLSFLPQISTAFYDPTLVPQDSEEIKDGIIRSTEGIFGMQLCRTPAGADPPQRSSRSRRTLR